MCLMLAKWFYISNARVQRRPIRAVRCNGLLGDAPRLVKDIHSLYIDLGAFHEVLFNFASDANSGFFVDGGAKKNIAVYLYPYLVFSVGENVLFSGELLDDVAANIHRGVVFGG